MSTSRATWLPLAIPLALAVLVFARAIGFPFVGWDDASHFSENPLALHPLARGVHDLFLTREIGYPAPVLLLTYALDRAVWGLNPAPYHAEDLALHLLNVSLLFAVARRMRLTSIEACAVATVFAIHPLVVEPVCWVTGRKDLLATAMVLSSSLLVAGRGAEAQMTSAWRWAVANVVAVCAVLVVPRAVVGSILIAIFVHAMRPAWSVRRVALRMAAALPVALVIIAVGARQIASLGALPPPRSAAGVVADVTGAWALQLSHVLFPVDLTTYYFRVPGDPPLWMMIAATAAAVAALAWVAWRAPPDSPARTAAMLTIVAYAPASCLFVIRRWTADSYMYLPLATMSLGAVPVVVRAWPARLGRFGLAAASAGALVLALLAFAGTPRWSSTMNVWAGAIARYPNEPLSYEHEALGLRGAGRYAEADALFLEIADRFPDWEDTLDDEVHAYEAAGDPRRAAEVLAHGVRIGSPACLRIYWMRLITSPTLPSPGERDLVAIAFENGFGAMKEGLHDPAAFRRVAVILDSVGLRDRADQVREYVRHL